MSVSGLRRGDVVIVDFTPTNPAAQIRLALVVQNGRDNAGMGNTIVAQITTSIRRAGQETQLLIDSTHHDWSASGLRHPSVVNCSNLATIDQRDVTRRTGSLSAGTVKQVEQCLKAAPGITKRTGGQNPDRADTARHVIELPKFSKVGGTGLVERIRLCERLLRRSVSSAEELAGREVAELREVADGLERELTRSWPE